MAAATVLVFIISILVTISMWLQRLWQSASFHFLLLFHLSAATRSYAFVRILIPVSFGTPSFTRKVSTMRLSLNISLFSFDENFDTKFIFFILLLDTWTFSFVITFLIFWLLDTSWTLPLSLINQLQDNLSGNILVLLYSFTFRQHSEVFIIPNVLNLRLWSVRKLSLLVDVVGCGWMSCQRPSGSFVRDIYAAATTTTTITSIATATTA